MTRDVVYATATQHVAGPDGGPVLVRHGSHWFADDPMVLAHPGLFSPNPCYGLTWTGEPPEEMSRPPEEFEQATAAPGERRRGGRLPNPMAGETRG